MEGLGREIDGAHFRVRDFAAGWVAAPVESTSDRETFGRRRVRNQPNDRLISPIRKCVQGFTLQPAKRLAVRERCVDCGAVNEATVGILSPRLAQRQLGMANC
jgi:hypothetical protein